MKYLKNYESMFSKKKKMATKPVPKYPVDKCIDLLAIRDILKEKYKMDLSNLRPGVKTKNEYHDFNFYDFLGKKLNDNVIYPKLRMKDIDSDPRSETHIDSGSVILLPISYDASNDYNDWLKQKEINRNKLIDMFKKSYKGEKLEQMIKDIDENVDFGRHDFSWVNDVLEATHKEFGQYYENGFLRVWYPFDWDGDAKTEPFYPFDKLLYFSEMMDYIETNYDVDTEGAYEWFLKQDYIEGRYYERQVGLYLDGDKIKDKPAFDGKNPSENVKTIIGIMNEEFKDEIKKCVDDEYFQYYMDIYKKVRMF